MAYRKEDVGENWTRLQKNLAVSIRTTALGNENKKATMAFASR